MAQRSFVLARLLEYLAGLKEEEVDVTCGVLPGVSAGQSLRPGATSLPTEPTFCSSCKFRYFRHVRLTTPVCNLCLRSVVAEGPRLPEHGREHCQHASTCCRRHDCRSVSVDRLPGYGQPRVAQLVAARFLLARAVINSRPHRQPARLTRRDAPSHTYQG